MIDPSASGPSVNSLASQSIDCCVTTLSHWIGQEALETLSERGQYIDQVRGRVDLRVLNIA
jgi:hypothetical protein